MDKIKHQIKFGPGLFIAIGLVSITSGTADLRYAVNKCTATACSVERLETAARIIKFSDSSINPCDNFYRFACGNHRKTDKFNDGTHPLSNNDYLVQLIQNGGSDFKPYRLIDDFYKTCVNKNVKGQQALDLLHRIIKNLGGWPVLEGDEWKESEFNWIDFTSNAKKVGFNINYFLDWKQEPTHLEGQRSLRYSVRMPYNYFDPSMLEKTTLQKQIYSDYMLKIARLLGAEVGDFVKDMDDVFEFEEQLANINATENPYYTEDMSVEEFRNRWPSIDWNRFVDKTLIPFIDNEKPFLTVWNSTAMTKFVDLITKTPKRVQANYGIWKVVQYSVPYLTDEFQEMQKFFHRVVGYPKVQRQDYCIGMVKNYLGLALDYLFLDQYKSSQATIRSIAESIKHEMTKMIVESRKLTAEGKQEGIRTIAGIPFTIGPSMKLSDPKELKKYYAGVQIIKDNFLQTVLNLNVFKMKKEFSIKTALEVSPFNPAFSVSPGMPEMQSRRLYIPASMIPGRLFNQNRPMFMNFGATGSYIAINIAESVVHVGRNWTDEGNELPNEQLNCFRRYDELPDQKSRNFMRRNRPEDLITQYIGFRSSRAAYRTYGIQHGAEPPLAEVPYTTGQLFWISFAQSFCDGYSKFNDPRTIDGGKLSDLEYMMMKIMSHIPEISDDFKCPVGSKLNPEHKCSWW